MAVEIKYRKALELRVHGLYLGLCKSREEAYLALMNHMAYPASVIGFSETRGDLEHTVNLEDARAIQAAISGIQDSEWSETLRCFVQEGSVGYFRCEEGLIRSVPLVHSKAAAHERLVRLLEDEMMWGIPRNELLGVYGPESLWLLAPIVAINAQIEEQIAASSLPSKKTPADQMVETEERANGVHGFRFMSGLIGVDVKHPDDEEEEE